MTRTTLFSRASLVVAALSLLGALVFAQAPRADAERRLQQARTRATVEGKLDEAVKLYADIITTFKNDRPAVVRALIEMADCYEKLGQVKARALYEQVVRDFGDQAEAVAVARARLTAIARGTVAVAQTATVRNVLPADRLEDDEGTPTPDGRYYLCADWTPHNDGGIEIHELATGEVRRVRAKASTDVQPAWAYKPSASPDGRTIAYIWSFNSWEIRVVPFDGRQGPRTIVRGPGSTSALWLGWFSGGDRVAVVTATGDHQVSVMDVAVADGRTRTSLPLGDVGFDASFALSPDNRFLAFDRPHTAHSTERDIYTLSLQTGVVSPVVTDSSHDYLLGWSPAGDQVVFATDRTGSTGIWGVPVSNGKASGTPYQIRSDVGLIQPMAITPGGSIFYTLISHAPDVYVADLDLTSRSVTPPVALADRTIRQRVAPAWSHDGRFFSYVRRRLPRSLAPDTLVIRDVSANTERQVPLTVRHGGGTSWSPDDGSLLVTAATGSGGLTGLVIDVSTGAAKETGSRPGESMVPLGWGAEDRSIVLYRGPANARDAGAPSIVVRSLDSGTERVVFQAEEGHRISGPGSVSPDGTHAAFLIAAPGARSTGDLHVLDLAGGALRLLRKGGPESLIGAIGWTPDSRSLVVAQQRPGVSGLTRDGTRRLPWLWLVPVDGGEPREFGVELPQWANHLRIRPDGRQLAFTAGYFEQELWVMENVIPAVKKGR